MSAGHNKYATAVVALWVGLALLLIRSLPRRLAIVHRLLIQHGPSGSASLALPSCLCNALCGGCHFSTGQEVGRVVVDRCITGGFQVPITETSVGAELDVSTAED